MLSTITCAFSGNCQPTKSCWANAIFQFSDCSALPQQLTDDDDDDDVAFSADLERGAYEHCPEDKPEDRDLETERDRGN